MGPPGGGEERPLGRAQAAGGEAVESVGRAKCVQHDCSNLVTTFNFRHINFNHFIAGADNDDLVPHDARDFVVDVQSGVFDERDVVVSGDPIGCGTGSPSSGARSNSSGRTSG